MSSDDQGNIIIWNGEDYTLINDDLKGFAASASNNGELISVRNEDNSISIYRVEFWELIKTSIPLDTITLNMEWSPNNQSIAIGSLDPNVYIWDFISSDFIILGTHDGIHVRGVSWSPDGKYLATGASDDTIIIWDVEKRQEFIRWHVMPTNDDLNGKMINSIEWSPDGTVIATSGWDDKIILRNAHTGQVIKELQGESAAIYAIGWSQSGMLASAGSGGSLQIWGD